jgi:hypothetical protein
MTDFPISWTHLLLAPAYLLLGALRHELAHAVSARLSGWRVTEFKFWPHRREEGWCFGYVAWRSDAPATIEALRSFYSAPVLAAIVSYVVGEVGAELLPLRLDGLIVWLAATEVTALADIGWLMLRRVLWDDGDLAELRRLRSQSGRI